MSDPFDNDPEEFASKPKKVKNRELKEILEEIRDSMVTKEDAKSYMNVIDIRMEEAERQRGAEQRQRIEWQRQLEASEALVRELQNEIAELRGIRPPHAVEKKAKVKKCVKN